MGELLLVAIVGVAAVWTAWLLWRQVTGKEQGCCATRQCHQCSPNAEAGQQITTIAGPPKGPEETERSMDQGWRPSHSGNRLDSPSGRSTGGD